MTVVKKYIIERTGLSKAFPNFSNAEYASFRSQWIRDNLVQSSEEFSEDGLTQTITLIFEDDAQLQAFRTACYEKEQELGITEVADLKTLFETDDDLTVSKELITE